MSRLSFSGSEKAIFSLRELYESFGYSRYKMSKFEEYDLYVRHGDALISEGVITFTDIGGKLMALKPDVTLSIIKNSSEGLQKVYYNENVYRVSKGTGSFKEIMQVGLECMGDVDEYCICEVVELAAKSLMSISCDAVLDISHQGVIYDVLDGCELSKPQRLGIIKCIGEKNLHELRSLCAEYGVEEGKAELLCRILSLSGDAKTVISGLEGMIQGAALEQLKTVVDSLGDLARIVNIDFSVVNSGEYYNGIVFKGFIQGVPSCVISGGQYDKLMRKMSKSGRAIGFAVYIDLLERLSEDEKDFDGDVLLIYSEKDDIGAVKAVAEKMRREGENVAALKEIPQNSRYRRVMYFGE